jgi:hypothetical protein
MKHNLIKLMTVAVIFTVMTLSSCKNDSEPEPANEFVYKQGTTEFAVNKEEKTVTITDKGQGFGGDYTMYSDTTYILDGRVFVNNDQTLTIEPGTMIQGMPGQGENASALIVAIGGYIDAQGTATEPIVFTGLGDTYDGTGVFVKKVRGLWGGLIILGNGVTNNSTQKRIEGIPETEPRGIYGGTDELDNSGILEYVSIRHGGTEIGGDNEINGLSLGAVGSETVIDFIEIIGNLDDGIEFFGGSVNVKHSIVTYCGDDSYDYDEGYNGNGQFWLAIQDYSTGDRCAEQDGGDRCAEQDGSVDQENGSDDIQSQPVIFNATYLSKKGEVMIFRDHSGGTYANSIFANGSAGVRIEQRSDMGSSYTMLLNDLLVIKNNVFQGVTADAGSSVPMFVKNESTGDEPADADANAADHFTNNDNGIEDLGLVADADGIEFVVIPTTTPTTPTSSIPADDFFDDVNYHGAFGTTNWGEGWALTFK